MKVLSRLAAHWRILAAPFDRRGVPGGAGPIRLPFNESPILATYLHTAYFFGILTAEGPCDGLLNVFIQLSAPRSREDRLNVLPLRFLPTIPADKLGLLESGDWTADEIGRMGKAGLVRTIAEALAQRHFLYVHLNYFFIPGTEFHRRHHFRQSALVTGFDPATRRFSVACYLRKGQFGVTWIPCILLAEAFFSPLGRANSTEASRVNRLHRMRRPDAAPAAARLDPDAIRWQLADYLRGTNEAPSRMENAVIRDWSRRFDTSTPADTRYGTGVTEGIIEALRSTDLNASRRIDFRITRLLWEHKKLMTVRLRRLSEAGLLGDPGLVGRWEEVEIMAWSLHFNLYRSVARKERIDAAAAESALRALAEAERPILEAVLGALEGR